MGMEVSSYWNSNQREMPNEKYIEGLKIYVSGFETNPYGIEWMRFEKESPISELIKTVPHIAFEVDNMEEALKEERKY